MKIEVFLVLFSFCLYLADARGIDHSDSENPSEGSDNDEFDGISNDGDPSDRNEFDEADFSEDEDWIVGDNPQKNEENSGLNDEQSAILQKMLKNQWNQNGEKNLEQSVQASDRLMKELRDCYRSAMYKNNEYSIELVDDSLYNWNIIVRSIDPDSELYKDLQKLKEEEGQDGILFNIKFGANYPFEVPFVRVVYPVISNGHVYDGGAICMELLHPKGWSSVYTVETIITQLTATIVEGNGRVRFGARDQGPEAAKRRYQGLDAYHDGRGWGDQNQY